MVGVVASQVYLHPKPSQGTERPSQRKRETPILCTVHVHVLINLAPALATVFCEVGNTHLSHLLKVLRFVVFICAHSSRWNGVA